MSTNLTLPTALSTSGVTTKMGAPELNQHLVDFPNGYGASIVQHYGSYGGDEGLWELAVLNRKGKLDYTTPITDDALGHLTSEKVGEILLQIHALPPAE